MKEGGQEGTSERGESGEVLTKDSSTADGTVTEHKTEITCRIPAERELAKPSQRKTEAKKVQPNRHGRKQQKRNVRGSLAYFFSKQRATGRFWRRSYGSKLNCESVRV